ncbi:uncharacterized protein LOC111136913 isoform X2 [Crassostrea virginica]|uniref:Proline-rich transmembrane protein 1-like n=1 Tax=Crassostrea virginica TaxID=6565 RepID=A0A8B8EUZ1_CRAVI|nr:proline-rich transmembrane protein 1-like [Crassostrea virginica]
METFPAVKYSRLGGTEEQELPYTCNTSKTYGTSGSRYQIVHGHRNPLDVEKTEYPPSSENDLIRVHKPLKDRLKYAIPVCLFCFFPTGILAIKYALQARSAWRQGEIKKAREKSSISKDFIRASVCLGMIAYILILVVILSILIFNVHS